VPFEEVVREYHSIHHLAVSVGKRGRIYFCRSKANQSAKIA